MQIKQEVKGPDRSSEQQKPTKSLIPRYCYQSTISDIFRQTSKVYFDLQRLSNPSNLLFKLIIKLYLFFQFQKILFLKIFLYLFLCKKFAPVPLGPHPTCTMGIIIWIISNLHALRTFNKSHCFYGVLDRRFVYTFLCKKIDFLRCGSTPTSVDLYYKK